LGRTVNEPLPGPVQDFARALLRAGFSPGSDIQGSSFGDWCIEYRRDALWIRVIRDRGTMAVVASPSDDHWYDFDVWRACLDDVAARAAPTPFEDQLRNFLERLREIERAAADNTTGACLSTKGRQRTEEMLGF
jgi:hypothetical protein